MYSIDNTVSSEGVLKTINTGIQENLELESVVYGPSSKKEGSQNALVFNFKQGELPFRHMEFAIDVERERKNGERFYDILKRKENEGGKKVDKSKEDFVSDHVATQFRNQAARVKHIMIKFMSEKDTLISGVNTFEAFSNAVINVIGAKNKGVKLRAKLIYNAKDYVSFPKFPPFLEVQNEEATKLVINPNNRFDRITKQTPDSPKEQEDQGEY